MKKFQSLTPTVACKAGTLVAPFVSMNHRDLFARTSLTLFLLSTLVNSPWPNNVIPRGDKSGPQQTPKAQFIVQQALSREKAALARLDEQCAKAPKGNPKSETCKKASEQYLVALNETFHLKLALIVGKPDGAFPR